MKFLLGVFTWIVLLSTVKLLLNIPKNASKAPRMFIGSAFFQKCERFVDKSAKVLMAETVASTPDRMFVEIRYKSLYMETYMVKQIISPPIKHFTLAEIFICKQRNNKILSWYGRRKDTFCANRPLTGVTITFIRCLYRVTGVSIGQGESCHSCTRHYVLTCSMILPKSLKYF